MCVGCTSKPPLRTSTENGKKNGPENSSGPFDFSRVFEDSVGGSFFRWSLLGWPFLGRGGLLFLQVLGVDLGFVPRQQEWSLRVANQSASKSDNRVLLKTLCLRLANDFDFHVGCGGRFDFFRSRTAEHLQNYVIAVNSGRFHYSHANVRVFETATRKPHYLARIAARFERRQEIRSVVTRLLQLSCTGNVQRGGPVRRTSRERYKLRNLVSDKLVASGLLVPDELVLEVSLDLRCVWGLKSNGTRQFPEAIRPLWRSHLQIDDAQTEMGNRVIRISRQYSFVGSGGRRIVLQRHRSHRGNRIEQNRVAFLRLIVCVLSHCIRLLPFVERL